MIQPFASDFSAGLGPLTFDPAQPGALAPTIEHGNVRLTVRAGSNPIPGRADERCEIREPDKVPLGAVTLHAWSMRLPYSFPRLPLRCVVAQCKLSHQESPFFALRVHDRKLFADWRVGAVRVEHHEPLTSLSDIWLRFELAIGPAGASLFLNGQRVTRLGADLGEGQRWMKWGPYRDADTRWGSGTLFVDYRDISRRVVENRSGE